MLGEQDVSLSFGANVVLCSLPSATHERAADGGRFSQWGRREWGARAALCGGGCVPRWGFGMLRACTRTAPCRRRGGGARTRLIAQRTGRLRDPFGGSVGLRVRVLCRLRPADRPTRRPWLACPGLISTGAGEMREMAGELERRGWRRAHSLLSVSGGQFSRWGRCGWGTRTAQCVGLHPRWEFGMLRACAAPCRRRGGGAPVRLMAQRTIRLRDSFGSFVELRVRVGSCVDSGRPWLPKV